jgi:hypothetical protein
MSALFAFEQQKLTASDGAAGDLFGISVAISGELALVGARRDDDNGESSGSAYVFERSGSVWSQVAKLTASDGVRAGFFGTSVAISGDLAVVGAFQNDDGDNSGSAYVFDASAGWSEVARLTASDGALNDGFGGSVAISGDLALVGAFSDDDGGQLSSGSAYVFERSEGVWSQVAKLTATDAAESDQFGVSVSISGDLALVGAHVDDDNGDGSGSAYVFELVPDPDSDGDGIPDGSDPDILSDMLSTFRDDAFKSGGGHRTAMQSILDDVESAIAGGDVDEAIRKLENLRRHVDGCGAAADNNDWITDCAAQLQVRDLIDALIANLSL